MAEPSLEDRRAAWFRRRTEEIAREKAAAAYRAWSRLGQPDDDAIFGAAGDDVLAGGGGADRLDGGAKPRPQLRGTSDFSNAVAGAVNAITAGPNSRGNFKVQERHRVELRRGAGDDVSAGAQVFGHEFGAQGRLEPPSARREVVVSGVTGRNGRRSLVEFPDRVRLFNTPAGELRIELNRDLRLPGLLGVFNKDAGQYVVR